MSCLVIVPCVHDKNIWVPHNAIGVSTIEDVRKHLHAKVVEIHWNVPMETIKELIVDIFPNMPNLKRLHFYDSRVTLEMHALCARMLRTHATVKYLSIRDGDDSLKNMAIQVMYIRALRHVHPPRMRKLSLCPHKNNLIQLIEHVRHAAPSMLEYCYEALEEK
jgi:hypothetical protein